ncbi:hypothetical protein [Paenibacillus massiliensis]|uniref:hypothetical protein n=1 Tax=Paenibacillus massiliensis TaxID=225917 RepID=UPI00046E5DB9|nr:hypothetical protein [Paenibacillus massiliensis]
MRDNRYRRPHSHRSLSDPYSSPSYPGVSPYEQAPQVDSPGLVPYAPQDSDLLTSTSASTDSKGGLLGGLASLGEIKGFIDRMGGVDGMIATIGKVQKVMSTMQQFAPMAKLIMGSLPFGKGGGKGLLATDDSYDDYDPPRRRKKTAPKRGTPRKRSSKRRRR